MVHQLLQRTVIILLVTSTLTFWAEAETLKPSQAGPSDQPIDAWRDLKFGLFVHWGSISLLGKEISWSRGGVRVGLPRENIFAWPGYMGDVPAELYDNLYRVFDPYKFNGRQCAEVMKAAGMKYIVFMTRHHDGFSMYDTKLSDYKITNSPYGKDLLPELLEACREAGIKIGLYYSQVNWTHPDWNRQNLERYREYMFGQVREILTNYGKIDIMWFDGVCGNPDVWQSQKLVAMVRQLQPGILVNDRSGDPSLGDFETPEQVIGRFNREYPWECCMTIGHQWAWRLDERCKSSEECLAALIYCAAGDGNLLFNLGPRPTGEFEPEQEATLRKMGEWLGKYGESIYSTRGGPWRPSPVAASTHRDNTIYVHVLDWQGGEHLTMQPIERRVTGASLLTGGQVSYSQNPEGIELTVKQADQQKVDTIVKLELDGPADSIEPLVATRSGSLAFAAKAAASNILNNDSNFGPDKAFDDDFETRWAAAPSQDGTWGLECDLGKVRQIHRVFINEWNQSYYSYGIRKFELQYKNQPQEAWKTFHEGERVGRLFKLNFEPVQARFVRLHILAKDPTYQEDPGINEFQIFGEN